jgi:hypothetical protein
MSVDCVILCSICLNALGLAASGCVNCNGVFCDHVFALVLAASDPELFVGEFLDLAQVEQDEIIYLAIKLICLQRDSNVHSPMRI